MLRYLLPLISIALAGAAAINVIAQQPMPNRFAHGYWTGGAFGDLETGRFSFCAMSANLDAGNRVTIRALPSGTFSVSIKNGNWHFHSGDIIRLVAQIDEDEIFTSTARVVRENIAVLAKSNSDRLIAAIRQRASRSRCSGPLVLPFHLNTDGRAMSSLRACAEKFHSHSQAGIANESAAPLSGNFDGLYDRLLDYSLELPPLSGTVHHPRTPRPRKFGEQRDSVFAGEVRIDLQVRRRPCTIGESAPVTDALPEVAFTSRPLPPIPGFEIDPIEVEIDPIGPIVIDRVIVNPVEVPEIGLAPISIIPWDFAGATQPDPIVPMTRPIPDMRQEFMITVPPVMVREIRAAIRVETDLSTDFRTDFKTDFRTSFSTDVERQDEIRFDDRGIRDKPPIDAVEVGGHSVADSRRRARSVRNYALVLDSLQVAEWGLVPIELHLQEPRAENRVHIPAVDPDVTDFDGKQLQNILREALSDINP